MAQQTVKRARRRTSGRGSLFGVTLVVAILIGILSVRCYNLYQTNQEYQAEYEALLEEEETLLAQQEEIEEYAEYVKTDAFVIEMAREKLGLVFPDEIIFRAE